MLQKIRRLRGRSSAELRFRGMQAVTAYRERILLLLGRPRRFEQSTSIPPADLISSIRRAYAKSTLEGSTPKDIVARLRLTDPVVIDRSRQATAGIRRGELDLLGLGSRFVGNPPRWHRDPVSGACAPRVHWSRIPYLDTRVVGDHKSLWEVNRHQYLLAPAIVWLADGDETALAVIQDHLQSWLNENPPTLGVNWASSLEVSYRAITWCWLLWLLQDAPWDAGLLSRVSDALEVHGVHIERNLSIYFSPNTHLTGEALGLFYLGTILGSSKHAERWRRRGAEILERALATQVLTDGVYVEQATLYQRYTTEIYIHYLILAEATDWHVARSVIDAIERLLVVIRTLVDGVGVLPVIGDDDGGLLLPIDGRRPQDLAGLLLAGSVLLKRPELALATPINPAMAYALCGVSDSDRLLQTVGLAPSWQDMYFARGGCVVIRDGWDADSAVAVIDAGPHGFMNGAHAHSDALSMTLALGSTALFVDRGTLTYVGPERNEFRSTISHNTLELDGQSAVEPLSPFRWGAIPPQPTGQLCVSEPIALFRGVAAGHAGSRRESTHSRVVVHRRGGAWIIFDHAIRSESRSAVIRWQLAADLQVARPVAGGYDIRNATDQRVAHVFIASGGILDVDNRDVSERYGSRASASVLCAATDERLRAITVVLPGTDSSIVSAVTEFDNKLGEAYTWTDTDGEHRLAIAKAAIPDADIAAALLPGWSGCLDLIWCMSSSPAANASGFVPDLIVGCGVSRLTAPGGQVLCGGPGDAAPRDVVVSLRGDRWGILPMIEPRTGPE